MGALSLRRASLLFADRSARASRLPLSSPCLSSSPLLNKGNGLLVLHPTDTPNSRHPQDPAGFQLSAFPGYPAKGRPPANNARKPTCLHSLPQEHLPCFGFRRRHGAHELPVPAAQPHAVGRCSAPHSRGGWVLAPPPAAPLLLPVPPTPPFHRQLQRSPSHRRCRRRDRWCPRRHTCLGFILAPNLHYFTRQPATYRCHPHAANSGGGGGVVKKNNTPNPPKPGAALPPPPPPPQLRPRAKVTFAREAASPKVPGKAPPAPPAAATRLKGVEIRGVL